MTRAAYGKSRTAADDVVRLERGHDNCHVCLSLGGSVMSGGLSCRVSGTGGCRLIAVDGAGSQRGNRLAHSNTVGKRYLQKIENDIIVLSNLDIFVLSELYKDTYSPLHYR